MVRNELERERHSVRRYLLNQLTTSEQQAVELKLLSDEAFADELEIVEDELIDEYLRGELSTKERASFEKYFLAHETRQRKLQAGEALKRHFHKVSPNPIPSAPSSNLGFFGSFLRSPSFAVAVSIIGVAVIGVVGWYALFSESNLQKGRLALNEAYRQERPVEARISEQAYAPFSPTRGGPDKVNKLEQSRAERLLSEAFSESANADTHHALGRMFLLQRQTDKAIEHLEQAKKADSNNPNIYADLGAAYLEKGKLEFDPEPGKSSEAFRLSLENLQRALELNPNLHAALFNRALVHQYQDQNEEAEADWRAYLERDSSSQWATEARDNLRLLEERRR